MDERPTAERDRQVQRLLVQYPDAEAGDLRHAAEAGCAAPVSRRRSGGRAASTIPQRAIQTNIEQTGWHEVTDQCVLDYLVVGAARHGRGMNRISRTCRPAR